MNFTQAFDAAEKASAITLIVALLGLASYFALEPVVSRAVSATPETFTISQTITADIAFTTAPSDVTMSGSLGGVTGGLASGSTTVKVTTNNATGYFMTIQFSTGTPMVLETGTAEIANYTPTDPNVPDFAFSAPASGQAAEFAYTITASSATDLDPTFRDDTSDCGTGAADTGGGASCWYNASTTNGSTPITEQVILTSGPTEPSGSTSTLAFKVAVPSSPNPVLPSGVYTATATLTATTN